jgi:type I restriction enzyme S subunit
MTENNNIPKNWQIKKLGEVCEIKNGKNQKMVTNPNGKYPIYGSAGIMGFADEYLCEEGTTVIGRKGTINRPIYVNTKFWNVDTAFGFSPKKEFLDNKFLFFFCQSFNFHKLDKSTTIPSLAKSDLQKIDIVLPPLPEQQSIVAKIEELLSELDKGKEQLLTAQQQLKVYRHSLLKWALENNDYPIFNLVDLNIKIQIGPFGTQLHKEDYIDNGIPLINPMHIQNGKIVPNYSYSIRNEKMQSLPNYILKEGDVIMGRRGEMGRCGLVSKTEDGWFCGTGSLFFRPNPTKLNSRFLYYFLSSQPIKKYLELNAGGTTMANLNLKIVKEIPIKLPEIKEQEEIVNEIESKLTICDKIEETISQSLLQAETLRQSILKKAFEGRLVKINEKDVYER